MAGNYSERSKAVDEPRRNPQVILRLVSRGPFLKARQQVFHLQRPDVSAPEDLGLRLAVAAAYGVPAEEAATVMERQREAWSPFNSVAARVLWLSRRAAMAK